MAAGFVQSASQITASSTTNVLAYTSNNTLGSLLVVVTLNGDSTTVTGVTDSQGNTWAKAIDVVFNFSTKDAGIWYALNAKAGANTVTVTLGAAGTSVIIIAEYRWVVPTSALDQTAASSVGDGPGTTDSDSGSTATTTSTEELLIGMAGAGNNNITFTAVGNWLVRDQKTDGTNFKSICLLEQNVIAKAAYNATATNSSAVQWGACIATFVAAETFPAPNNLKMSALLRM